MEVVLTILKVYFICTVLLMLIYAVRHAVFPITGCLDASACITAISTIAICPPCPS